MNSCLSYQALPNEKASLLENKNLHLFAVLILFIALVFRVWIRIETVSLGYRLADAKEQTITLDMERRELEMKLSVMLRSDNLTLMAKERLDLLPPKPGQIIRIVERSS